MSKALTWGTCLDFTINNRETWMTGNGRKSALHYSGLFTEFQGRSFPIKHIDYPLMYELGNRLRKRGMTHAAVNRFTSAVSTVIKFCKEMKVANISLDELPFHRFKEEESNRTFFSKDHVKDMIEFARTQMRRDDLADVIQFAALTGMRQSEILNLPAKWVDFSHNILKLEKCKWGKARTIPIHPLLLPILQSRVEFTKPDVKVFGDEWENADQLRRVFYTCINYLGLKPEDGYHFHSLRYSFGTWHMASGTPPIDVMNMLGHTNLKTTLGYAKSTDESQQKHTHQLQF